MELYTCSTDAHQSEIPAEWDKDGGGKGNITFPKSYNELATLMSVPGECRNQVLRTQSHCGGNLSTGLDLGIGLRQNMLWSSSNRPFFSLSICLQARMPSGICSAGGRTCSLATPPSSPCSSSTFWGRPGRRAPPSAQVGAATRGALALFWVFGVEEAWAAGSAISAGGRCSEGGLFSKHLVVGWSSILLCMLPLHSFVTCAPAAAGVQCSQHLPASPCCPRPARRRVCAHAADRRLHRPAGGAGDGAHGGASGQGLHWVRVACPCPMKVASTSSGA